MWSWSTASRRRSDHGPLRRRAQAWLDLSLYKRCATIITASELLADWLHHSVVVPPGRDHQAQTQVTETQVTQTQVTDLRGDARAAALCVANWLPNKGILELLDAVAALPPGTLRLHLAGDERTGTSYGQRALRQIGGLSDRVTRHGPSDDADVARLYRSADFFVLPSR
jgi:glycosyltransferase involved in cell wall biosynthesis